MTDDRPLRILHCFRSPIGGIFRHVRDLAREQSRSGHEVGIVCDSSTGGEHEDRLFASIEPFLALGLRRFPIARSIGLRDIPAFWRSYKEIRSLQPDVLHGHGAKGGAIARSIGSVLRVNRYCVARLYTPHGGSLHFNERRLSGWAVFRLEKLQELATDALVFVCDFEERTYRQKVGRPWTRTKRVYNGIGEADFEPVPEGPNPVNFLYVGMLRDLKGPDLFVDAFAKAERILKRPLSAMMIGDGPDRDKYLQMMTERGLGQRIRMRPAMPIREAFKFSPIVVVPSRAESMPYIVLEALGAGKSVIASDVGGIAEVLGSGSAALVEPGNSDDLARVMAEAMSKPDWREATMPRNEAFRDVFSASTMAREITGLYREILASR